MIEFVLLIENLLMPFGAALMVLKFLLSPRRTALKNLWNELPERFGRPPASELARLAKRPTVWLHCASAGEVNAAAALVALLADRGLAVVLTTTTAAGRERARALHGVAAAWLAPLDCWPAVSRFVRSVDPRALIVVETELWPHMIALSALHGARCAIVNARLTERAFSRYKLFAAFARPFLGRCELVAAQTQADAERYRALGARYVVVCGNMKHDQVGAGVVSEPTRSVLETLGWAGCPVLCAGSTHPGEEDEVVAAFLRAKASHPALKLMIAPRHPERAGDCAETLRRLGVAFDFYSHARPGLDAVVVDRLGLLGQLYSLATVAFVGGTLVPVGGHNVLEPALAGVPVLFGPHHEHAAEAAHLLESAGAGFCAADGPRLAQLLSELLADAPRARAIGDLARRTAAGLQGAADRTIKELSPLLP